ncbi:hypothetical protein J3R83DRAFT_9030 [Lanmaoa asiatica]|nr:hypothetical protein J3R83DRAFT_9030 [Lanmaoa asiatica]
MSDQPCLTLICWVTSLPPHSALVAMNAMSSLVLANFSGTNSSACFERPASSTHHPPSPSSSLRVLPLTRWRIRTKIQWSPLLNIIGLAGGGNAYFAQPLSALFLVFNQALARDGYRCMVTGMFDSDSLLHRTELQVMATGDHVHEATVQTCHILNESTIQLRGDE